MLELDEVVRRFGDRTVVDHVSFRVRPGQVTGFVGGNGAGKTTTMRMIMGVLAIRGGEIRWNGRPPTREDRRAFGYMPEERGLYPKQSVLSQLRYLGRLRGLAPRGAQRAVDDCSSASASTRSGKPSWSRCRWATSSGCRSSRR